MVRRGQPTQAPAPEPGGSGRWSVRPVTGRGSVQAEKARSGRLTLRPAPKSRQRGMPMRFAYRPSPLGCAALAGGHRPAGAVAARPRGPRSEGNSRCGWWAPRSAVTDMDDAGNLMLVRQHRLVPSDLEERPSSCSALCSTGGWTLVPSYQLLCPPQQGEAGLGHGFAVLLLVGWGSGSEDVPGLAVLFQLKRRPRAAMTPTAAVIALVRSPRVGAPVCVRAVYLKTWPRVRCARSFRTFFHKSDK